MSTTLSTSTGGVVRGVGVSPGRAAGPVARLRPPAGEPPATPPVPAEQVDAEVERVAAAAGAVQAALEASAGTVDGERRELLETTAQMATDPTLVGAAQDLVRSGVPAPHAVWQAAGTVAEQLRALGGYLAERARDVADVRDRIIAELTGSPVPGVPQREEPFVLVAVDLAPADTALLDPELVRAVVTAEGGPTSHTAILARSLGIPAVVGLPDATEVLAEGSVVLVDGGAGTVDLAPGPDDVAAAQRRTTSPRPFDGRGRTRDGHPVDLFANVGDPASAAAAADAGAQGVGLFRTEFCFLDRTEEPGVEEQAAAYRRVLERFPGQKVVIRTLDAGADKPLPFVTDAEEANPALGVRGLRTARRAPEVLEHQLEAIARAAEGTDAEVWVMAPMVSTVAETEEFVAACARHGLSTAGVMVEVPSAALLAGPILARAAFASIGTNDLTQYTMAADRLLGSLAELSDAWQPPVLRLVEATCTGGAQQSRPVGVCGEAAADPALAVVLVGLGVSSLSMTPRALGDVAAVLAATDLQTCRALARVAVDAESAADARAKVRDGLPVLAELGL